VVTVLAHAARPSRQRWLPNAAIGRTLLGTVLVVIGPGEWPVLTRVVSRAGRPQAYPMDRGSRPVGADGADTLRRMQWKAGL
jgi:hypothetical protein